MHVFGPMFCVTLNSLIRQWLDFVSGVTERVVSVTKSAGFAAHLYNRRDFPLGGTMRPYEGIFPIAMGKYPKCR